MKSLIFPSDCHIQLILVLLRKIFVSIQNNKHTYLIFIYGVYTNEIVTNIYNYTNTKIIHDQKISKLPMYILCMLVAYSYEIVQIKSNCQKFKYLPNVLLERSADQQKLISTTQKCSL